LNGSIPIVTVNKGPGAQPVGRGGRRAHRHLHQRISPPLRRGPFHPVTQVLKAELFTQPVELGLEDLTAERVQHPVDRDGAMERH
jgi:hypothetical protein